jgi:serine protease Do
VDCHAFDGQVVRLEKIKDAADQFVRVRLTRIDNADLSLFEFDYDLTFIVFFLNAEGKVYARYGGRDSTDADNRQSLAGLDYTMKSVLAMHARAEREYAPRSSEAPRTVRDYPGARPRGCVHCHQVKEAIYADLKAKGEWSRDLAWRYPPPDNVGLVLDVDRGNVIKAVRDGSPAAAAGLKAGDVVRRLNGVPVHSFSDAQFALDRAPRAGTVPIAWERGDKASAGQLELADGWRKTVITWRPSVQHLIPTARLSGTDLTAAEKAALGLAAGRLAFRQREAISSQAKAAGIRPGDVILGVDGQELNLDVSAFQRHVERNYLIGDRVTVNLLRDGKHMDVPMTLLR